MTSPDRARKKAVFLLSHPWMQEQIRAVAPSHFEVAFADPKDATAATSLLPGADFLVTTYLPADWVKMLAQCKLVQHQGVGFDGIDTQALGQAGIPFALTADGTVVGVAEHTILLILALSKQLVRVHEAMREGKYDSVAWRAGSHFLNEKTVGIVGFGRIGRRAAELAHAFGVKLLYSDVTRADAETEARLGARHVEFDALLAQSDIVSVHTPLVPATRGLFSAAAFAKMKPGAMFVNTSRGGTYDMDALYEALVGGHLGSAGLDVFNPEPPPKDHPILRLPNVICTPHMATGTVEAHRLKAQAQFANFDRVMAGLPPAGIAGQTGS